MLQKVMYKYKEAAEAALGEMLVAKSFSANSVHSKWVQSRGDTQVTVTMLMLSVIDDRRCKNIRTQQRIAQG